VHKNVLKQNVVYVLVSVLIHPFPLWMFIYNVIMSSGPSSSVFGDGIYVLSFKSFAREVLSNQSRVPLVLINVKIELGWFLPAFKFPQYFRCHFPPSIGWITLFNGCLKIKVCWQPYVWFLPDFTHEVFVQDLHCIKKHLWFYRADSVGISF